jgi:hypothetical protein
MPKGIYPRKVIVDLNYEEINWLIHSSSIVSSSNKRYLPTLNYLKGTIYSSGIDKECPEAQNLKLFRRNLLEGGFLSTKEREIFIEIEEIEKHWSLYSVLILPENIDTILEFYERLAYEEDLGKSPNETYWIKLKSFHYKQRMLQLIDHQIKFYEKEKIKNKRNEQKEH